MPLILAAPGTGKTTWVKKHPSWHDMDMLYADLHDETWHDRDHTEAEEAAHYRAIDAAVEKDRATKNIIGSLFEDIVPDAIVFIDQDIHRRRVQSRPDLQWPDVQRIVVRLHQIAVDHYVPRFTTFDAAAAFVARKKRRTAPLTTSEITVTPRRTARTASAP